MQALRGIYCGGYFWAVFCRVTVGLDHRCFHLRLIRLKAEGNRFDSHNARYVKQFTWKSRISPLRRLRDRRIKADEATIARSLQGHWREEHIFELTQALELYRFYQGKIAECDREIEAQLERFEDRSDGGPLASNGRRRSQGNAPRFDVRTHLYRMTGVDLTRIDGVDAYTALKVIREIGTDMTKWPSAKYFASWLGLSPNNRITGGRVISSKTKPSASRAAQLGYQLVPMSDAQPLGLPHGSEAAAA